jgi:hypothetical protein
LFSIAGLFLAFLLIRPEASREAPDVQPSKGRLGWLLNHLVPGYYDMRWNSAAVGYCSFLLFFFVLLCLVALRLAPRDWPLPGIVTLLVSPNFVDSVPFPNRADFGGDTPVTSYYYWTVFFAYAHARAFWSCVGLSAMISGMLHISRLVKMRRM